MSAPNINQEEIFELENSNGLHVRVISLGGKIMSLRVPDKQGRLDDVVLGYDHPNAYYTGNPYFGALIGRYANRIAGAKFTLDGTLYNLQANNGLNALHGGPRGFHQVHWHVEPLQTVHGAALKLSYVSKDGEEGFPGNLYVEVQYALSGENELVIDYEAVTDKPTIVNLTQHSFFNLRGEGFSHIADHQLTINAQTFCPVNQHLIPSGVIQSVAGTPFDFRDEHTIGQRIEEPDVQLSYAQGYDHCWVLNKHPSHQKVSFAARVREPFSGRVMEVWTSEPGLQFYSGNFLDGSDRGKGNKQYPFRSAFCLEAQRFPDSPNQSNFPSTVLRPGERYQQRTVYRFSIES